MNHIQKIITNVRYNVCIDEFEENEVKGRFYYCFSNKPVEFKTSLGMVSCLEKVMDTIGYPQKTTKSRIFKETKINEDDKLRELNERMSDSEVLKNRGEKATFVVEVKYRENATWQGTVKWVEGNKEQGFRSALELIKLIDSASETMEK